MPKKVAFVLAIVFFPIILQATSQRKRKPWEPNVGGVFTPDAHIAYLDSFELDFTSNDALIELEKFGWIYGDYHMGLFLEKCDNKVKNWLDKKILKFGYLRSMIPRWLSAVKQFVTLNDDNIDKAFKEDFRSKNTYGLYLKHRAPLSYHRTHYLRDKQVTQELKRAFYYGDGLCTHMQAPPFDRIGKFVELLFEDYSDFDMVKKLKKPHTEQPKFMQIYIAQKLCRKFEEKPEISRNKVKNAVSIEDIDNVELARSILIKNLDAITKSSRNCDWPRVYEHKQLYLLLNKLYGEEEKEEEEQGFVEIKYRILRNKVDHSIDTLIEHCTLSFEKSYDIENIYMKVSDKRKKLLLKELARQLRVAVSAYDLPMDQSINSFLDIKFSSNRLRKTVFDYIRQRINHEQDLEVSQLFRDLFLGRLGDFADGIFREPIYKENSVESESIEFLFQVLSIKGYKPKPQIESVLLDFYYLYKISEICNMIPVDETSVEAHS